MRTGSKIVMALALAALLAGTAAAQRQGFGRGFGGGMMGRPEMLLGNPSVQKELGLSEEQVGKVKEAQQSLMEKNRENFGKLRDASEEERQTMLKQMAEDTRKAYAGILKPEQEKRLKQIALQQRGVDALTDPEIQKDLKLTDEQKESLKTIQDDMRKDVQELFQGGGGGGNFQENFKKMAGLRKEALDKALATLKDDQKAKWKELTGKPFEMQMGFGGRGQGGRGRGQQKGKDKDKDK